MNTKIITEIIEKLKEEFDDNQLQTIERTLYRTLKDKEIIDVVRTQPQTNEEAFEYSCAVTPQIRQAGNRLSGLAGTAYASLLA